MNSIDRIEALLKRHPGKAFTISQLANHIQRSAVTARKQAKRLARHNPKVTFRNAPKNNLNYGARVSFSP